MTSDPQSTLFGPTAAPGFKPWQRSLPDPTENHPGLAHSNGPATEHAAAEFAMPRSGTHRAIALDAIASMGDAGLTDSELAELTGIWRYSIAPRRHDLAVDGWVIDSGRRRKTETGTPAIVFVLSERGRAEYDARRSEVA